MIEFTCVEKIGEAHYFYGKFLLNGSQYEAYWQRQINQSQDWYVLTDVLYYCEGDMIVIEENDPLWQEVLERIIRLGKHQDEKE